MIKVMFVCLGNYCRSPMAEAVFRKLVAEAGLSADIISDSSGTDGWNKGGSPHVKTLRLLEKKGISCEGLRGSHLSRKHFEFDYIIPMDEENLKDILALKTAMKNGVCNAEIQLLSHYTQSGWISVPDPWITGNFELAYERIDEGCRGLLEHIKEKCGFVTDS